MKIYVAQSHGKSPIAEYLREGGYDVTSSWDVEDSDYDPTSCYRALRDMVQIEECDVFIYVIGGDGINHHTELGIAIALNKHIVCVGKHERNIFGRMYCIVERIEDVF